MFLDLSQDVRGNREADLFWTPCLCSSIMLLSTMQFQFCHLGVVRLRNVIGNVLMSES